MTSDLRKTIDKIAEDGVIAKDKYAALIAKINEHEDREKLSTNAFSRLMQALQSVSQSVAAEVVGKIESINISRNLNPSFCTVSIAPDPLVLELPTEDTKMWDADVVDMIADKLAVELVKALTREGKVHYSGRNSVSKR